MLPQRAPGHTDFDAPIAGARARAALERVSPGRICFCDEAPENRSVPEISLG